MAPLSDAALTVLTALVYDDEAVVLTVRRSGEVKISAWMSTRANPYDKARRSYVRRPVFHVLQRAGLLVNAREWQAFGQIYTEYELTQAGRAAVEAG